jgi:integrase
MLNRFIRCCGVEDERKVLHNLRHRAANRMRALPYPQDVQDETLGHEMETVVKCYGRGSPVPELETRVDQIGH